ncbi:hypothetical protein HYV74_03085 [Candidatus Uhrbacteria bacterium]|nr:hypothetical protein [Candidatus Uhrbacteria bacterium]
MSNGSPLANTEQPANGDRRNRIADIGTAAANLVTYTLLSRFDYAYIRNKNTGDVRLEIGEEKRGKRIQLDANEELVGKWEKIRIADRKYAIIRNPFSAERDDVIPGDRDIRPGPTEFPLHPGEELEGIFDEYVLTDDDGLKLRAARDGVPHPLAGTNHVPERDTLRSGDEVNLWGPKRYIPHKDIVVVGQLRAIPLSEKQGKYIQNDDTGDVRLVRGMESDSLHLAHNESLWSKRLTGEELEALGYKEQTAPDGSRALAARPYARPLDSDAVVIDLEANEALCLYEGSRERVLFGPDTVFLNPHERPRVLHISGGVPVRANALRIAKLHLGPDFIRDELIVRTRDNATLTVRVTYSWRYVVDPADTKAARKLFALKDFVGFTTQTLASEIREEAAQHNFENFHAQAATLVQQKVFGAAQERAFPENGFVVFGIDVEGIEPEDPEIQRKLADAIKTNVDIYTSRVQEEAKLESERRVTEGKAKNEAARRALIELHEQNEHTRIIAEAERAAAAKRITAEADAEAIRIRSAAERTAEEARLQTITKILETPGGHAYIDLVRARVLRKTDKVVVPTDSKLVLGVGGLTGIGTGEES